MIFFLFFQLFLVINCNDESYERCLKPFCECFHLKLSCTNFTSFKQLDFKRSNSFRYDTVELMSANRLDLDRNLSFIGLNIFGSLLLSNVRSFTPFYNPFKDIIVSFEFNLFISNSTIELNTLGLSNSQLQSINSCNNFASKTDELLFSSLKINEFRFCNANFSQQLCPIVFSNANIEVFTIISPIGNSFGFRQMNGINSNAPSILKLVLSYASGNELPNNLANITQINSVYILNGQLFSAITSLEFNKLIYLEEIEASTFKSFKNLKKLELYDINLKKIFEKSRKWIKNLNIHENYDLDYLNLENNFQRDRVLIMLISTEENWTFKNDDICSFKYFPHDKLVYPLLLYTSTKKIECNCVVYYLYKYFDQYKFLYQANPIFFPIYCFENVNYENEIKKCEFDRVLNNCVEIEEPSLIITTTRTTAITTVTTTIPTTSRNDSTAISQLTTATTSTAISIISSSSTNVQPSTTTTTSTSTKVESTLITSSFSSTHTLVLKTEDLTPNYLKQTRASFYIGISLLVIAIGLVIVLTLVAYKTFFVKPRHRPSANKNFTTPSISIASINDIDYEECVIQRH